MVNIFSFSKFFLYLAPLAIITVSKSTLFPFIVGKYVWFRMSVDLALIFFFLGILFDSYRTNEFKIYEHLSAFAKNPLVIAVTAFVFIFILAGFFGVDSSNSFWSNFERGEGGFQLLHLWLFFALSVILFSGEKDWHKIFWLFIIAGTFMAFYGFVAGLKYVGAENGFWQRNFSGFLGPRLGERFQGTLGNPAYVATYSIFLLFYAAYLYFAKHYKNPFSWQSLSLYGAGVLFLVVFWLAATRGAFMGLIATLLAFIFYFIYSKKAYRGRLFLAISLIILIVGSMIYFKDAAFVKSIPGSRLFDISFKAETWEHRTYMWNMAWQGFKERPIFGWGPENYINVFDRNFDIRYFKPSEGFGAWFDRAHSVYFDYLAETGILGFLSFIAVWIVFYWKIFNQRLTTNDKRQSVNNKNQLLVVSHQSLISNALIFAMPISYLIQGIVLFDILPIYINVFMFLAFAAYKFQDFKLKNNETNN